MLTHTVRPDEEFSSHKWPSTSAWAAEELLLLHVSNVVVADIFDGMSIDSDTTRLTAILNAVSYSSEEYEDNAKADRDFARKHDQQHGYPVRLFYDAIAVLVLSSSNQIEEASTLNMPADHLMTYIETTGSAMPWARSESDSGDSTSGQPGSPPPVKKLSWNENLQGPTDRNSPTSADYELRPIIKSISDSSNLSAEMGTKEDQSEEALFKLLELMLYITEIQALSCRRSEQTYPVMFGAEKGANSTNDGSIVLGQRLADTNSVPLINVECKSRKANGPLAHSKISAQEFGESLAIVQERLRFTKNSFRWPSMHTVYTIAMHGRRAYLAKVDFDGQYMDGVECQNLGSQSITMKRTRAFRLDEKSELHAFIRIVYQLMSHLEAEVLAGRRV